MWIRGHMFAEVLYATFMRRVQDPALNFLMELMMDLWADEAEEGEEGNPEGEEGGEVNPEVDSTAPPVLPDATLDAHADADDAVVLVPVKVERIEDDVANHAEADYFARVESTDMACPDQDDVMTQYYEAQLDAEEAPSPTEHATDGQTALMDPNEPQHFAEAPVPEVPETQVCEEAETQVCPYEDASAVTAAPIHPEEPQCSSQAPLAQVPETQVCEEAETQVCPYQDVSGVTAAPIHPEEPKCSLEASVAQVPETQVCEEADMCPCEHTHVGPSVATASPMPHENQGVPHDKAPMEPMIVPEKLSAAGPADSTVGSLEGMGMKKRDKASKKQHQAELLAKMKALQCLC